MSDVTTVKSTEPADYQQVRSQMITPVNEASGSLPQSAGLYVQIPDATPGASRNVLIGVLSPLELINGSVSDDVLKQRITEAATSHPVQYHARKHIATYLDASSPMFQAMVTRVLGMIQAAIQNFRREIGDLVTIYDQFTRPVANLPACSAFHLKAAFGNPGLLGAYRTISGLPQPAAAIFSDAARARMKQLGVAVPTQLEGLKPALPAAPASLMMASQNKEVSIMVQALERAMQTGEISAMPLSETFRAALAHAVAQLRQSQPVLSPTPEQRLNG